MTDSIHKQIVSAVETLMGAIDGKIDVQVNTPLPETVPDDGLIIIRDVVANPTTEVLGGFDTVYVIGVLTIEVFVTAGDNDARDVKYDELLQAVGTKLLQRDANGNRSLGGLVYGVIIDRPDPLTQDIPGAEATKAASIKVHLEYDAPGALG